MNIFFIFSCFPKHRVHLYNGFIFIYLAVFLNSKDISIEIVYYEYIYFIFSCFYKHKGFQYYGFIYSANFLNSKDISTINIYILYLAVSLNTEDIYITDVRCGGDGTMFISHDGDLYACGSNKVKFCLVNK